MRTLNELFEYLTNSTDESLIKEFNEMGDKLIKQYGTDGDLYYKDSITKLNTLVEKMGHHFRNRFLPKLKTDKPVEEDELLNVEQVSKILKTSKQTINTMIKKGKIKTINFTSFDRPNVRGNIRIQRSELKNIGK